MRRNHKLVRAILAVKPAVPAIAWAALTGSASAALNIYEPFNYATGALQGSTNTSTGTSANGNIWQRAGTGNPPAGINVTSGSLTGPAQLPPSVGNELTISHVATGDGATNRLALDQNYTSGTVFYSFLLNVADLTNLNNTTGAFFFSLNNSADVSQTNNPSVVPGKVQIRIDPTDSSKYNLGVFGNEGATASANSWSGALDLNTTQFIVGSVQAGTTKDVKMWVNPDPASFGLNTAPAFTLRDQDPTLWSGDNIQSVLVRQSLLLPTLVMDELRAGGSWSDVTPTLAAYWDIDGATNPGAGGATPSGTWNGATTNWSASSAGDIAGIVWPGATYKAVFAAGTDATGAYTVTVSGAQTATALAFEEGSVTLTGGTLNLTSGVIDSVSSGNTMIGSTITGTAGLSKNGTGAAVILTGNLNYTGPTAVNAGTLQIGDGTTVGGLPTSSAISVNGTLVFNLSNSITQGIDFNGAGISGTGNLTQAGAGTLTLNTANTYSGTTKATAGTISVTNSQALQNSTVDTSGAGSIVFDNALTSVTVGGLSGANNYTANPAMSITVGNNTRNASFAGIISGSGSVTKIGTAMTQELSGLNTYSGGTNINAGILQFGPTNSMPATGAVTVNSGGTLSVHVGGAGEWTTGTSGVGTLGGLVAGDGGQSASQVTWNSGSSLGVNTQPVGSSTGNDVTFAGNIGNFNSVSDLTKSVGLTKRGLGSLTLTGTNTFRGPLQVDNAGGILRLSSVLSGAGQSMPVPTVTIGNAGGDNTITDGSRDTGIKILVNDALPTNSVISFGSSISGAERPSSLLQLYDGFVPSGGGHSGPSFNQTVRGMTGNSGRVKVGLGTFTVNVPDGETYVSGGTLRTDFQDSSTYGKVIKQGLGRQDWAQSNDNFNGDFILQQGTLGFGNAQVFGQTGSLSARLVINGGKLVNTSGGSLTMQVPKLQIGGSFAFDVLTQNNTLFLNPTITLATANPTITVNPAPSGTSGQFILQGKITDNGQGFGFTKAGAGTLNISPSGIAGVNNYSGPTTIQEGFLRIIDFSVIGNGLSDLNLSGGQLEYNGGTVTNARLLEVTNPVHVTANSSIAYSSTTANLTDVTDPTGVQFVFSNNTIDWTSGTLTFQHQATSQGITFRPRFTGSGFNYAGPVAISNGTSPRKTVLESANTSGTQTWSGNITGDGTFSRLTGGNTVLAGQLVSVGGIAIANNSAIQLGQSPGNNRVIKATNLTIGNTNSKLDLTNNKLITASAIGTLGSGNTYTGVTGLLQAGRGNGTWNGTTGIVTSQTHATLGSLTSLGVATAAEVKGIAGTATATWAGQTVSASDTLVMYTYGGDANLDGLINIDDYGHIDTSVGVGKTGWFNGDFNYDGVVNIDDYGIIDVNVGVQSLGTFPTAGGITGAQGTAGLGVVSAVPEPATFTMLSLGASVALLLKRRRATRNNATS